MDPFERSERLRAARRRQRTQRARRSRLRSRVVVTSVICFALLWGIVFTQMLTGNDPVLGDRTLARTKRVVAAAPPANPVEARGDGDGESEDDTAAAAAPSPTPEVPLQSTESRAPAEAASPAPEPVVTAQS